MICEVTRKLNRKLLNHVLRLEIRFKKSDLLSQVSPNTVTINANEKLMNWNKKINSYVVFATRPGFFRV